MGRKLAEILAGQGAHLCLLARDRAKLEQVRSELAGARVEISVCDVSDPAAVDAAFQVFILADALPGQAGSEIHCDERQREREGAVPAERVRAPAR